MHSRSTSSASSAERAEREVSEVRSQEREVSEEEQVARWSLCVPGHVELFQIHSGHPSASDLHQLEEEVEGPVFPRPKVPKLPLHRCNSDPPPFGRRAGGGHLALPPAAPWQRPSFRLQRPSEEDMSPVSPCDPKSFASQVFHGLGLADAKASVVVETRVGALKSRFEKTSSSSSTRTL